MRLAAGFIAASEGRLDDSDYVRELTYSMFEEGGFGTIAVRSRQELTSPSANLYVHHKRLFPPNAVAPL